MSEMLPIPDITNRTERTYTTKQVADMLGVHKNTILNWIRAGKIPEVARDWKSHRVWTEHDVGVARIQKENHRQMQLEI